MEEKKMAVIFLRVEDVIGIIDNDAMHIIPAAANNLDNAIQAIASKGHEVRIYLSTDTIPHGTALEDVKSRYDQYEFAQFIHGVFLSLQSSDQFVAMAKETLQGTLGAKFAFICPVDYLKYDRSVEANWVKTRGGGIEGLFKEQQQEKLNTILKFEKSAFKILQVDTQEYQERDHAISKLASAYHLYNSLTEELKATVTFVEEKTRDELAEDTETRRVATIQLNQTREEIKAVTKELRALFEKEFDFIKNLI